MLKLMGSGCVMGAGVWLLRNITVEERRRTAVLRDLEAALEVMADEIRINRTPMPRLLLKAGTGRCGEVMDFFMAVRMDSRTRGLSAAWRGAAAALPLPEQEKQALAGLGGCLTGDEEQICRGLLTVSQQLGCALKRQRETAAERGKRSAALCLSGAALMIILLI